MVTRIVLPLASPLGDKPDGPLEIIVNVELPSCGTMDLTQWREYYRTRAFELVSELFAHLPGGLGEVTHDNEVQV